MIRTLATLAVAAVSLNAAASDAYFRNVAQSFERGFGQPPAGTLAQDEAARRNLLASFERIMGSNAIAADLAAAPAADSRSTLSRLVPASPPRSPAIRLAGVGMER